MRFRGDERSGNRRYGRSALVAVAVLLAACTPASERGSTPQDAATAPAATEAGTGTEVASAAGTPGATAAPGGTASPEPSSPEPSSPEPSSPEPSSVEPSSTSPATAEATGPDGDGQQGQPSGDAAPDDGGSEPTATGPEFVEVDHGDTGEGVTLLQERLGDMGFDAGPADGVAGQLTVAAVEAFQEHAGLDVTGVVDTPTIAALQDGSLAVDVLTTSDSGEDVRELQEQLADAPFDPGPVDGVYGGKTAQAVYALQKLAGLAVDGRFDGVDRIALDRLLAGEPVEGAGTSTAHGRRWVDIDLSRQLMRIYDTDNSEVPLLAVHVSSGNGERWCNDSGHCGVAKTPTGSYTITRRIDGWRESSLDIGRLYNPLYFRGGIALHGALSVPLYPASHGCVRVPMHIAEYLPDLLPNGTPVEVHW